MKTASAVSLALFLGSITIAAWASAPKSKQPAVARKAPAGTGCPIDMQAQRQPGQGASAFVDNGDNGPAQSLHLILNNSRYAEIVGVQITARGFNAKARISPAQTAAAESSEIAKTMKLKLKVAGKSQASVTVVLPEFTSVASISLDSVQYSDGASWRASAGHTCQVYPDAGMLISRR